MFLYAISKETFYKLAFQPVYVRNGEIWRLFTWPLANQPSHLGRAHAALLLDHRPRRRGMVGRVRFAVLIVIITVVPAAIVTLLPPANFPTAHAAGLDILGDRDVRRVRRREPEHAFLLRMPAWVVAVVFVGDRDAAARRQPVLGIARCWG